MRVPFFTALTVLGSIGVFAACVGDDPDSTNPTPTPDSGTGDTSSSSGSTSDGGPTVDAPANEDADAAPIKRLVFVTAAQYPADVAKASDPWTAADKICADEALGSGLPGTFVAWISYQTGTGTTFNAGSRITDAPYYLPVNAAEGGAPVLVVESKMELLTTGPKVPIERRPNGTVTGTDSFKFAGVWTGTGATGNASGSDCKAWTLTDIDGNVQSATNGNAVLYQSPAPKDWTDFGGRLCTMPSRLYCFQK